MGSFLPHRPIMKARMLMVVEQARAMRVMAASSMLALLMLMLLLAAERCVLLLRCAGSPGRATRSGHGITHGKTESCTGNMQDGGRYVRVVAGHAWSVLR